MLKCSISIQIVFGLVVQFVQLNQIERFPCQSNLPYDFRNIDRFTDNMCAQCLWYMAGSEAPWNNFEMVHQWTMSYNYSDTINVMLCQQHDKCNPFTFEHLLDTNHSIVKEFKSTYYLDLLMDCCENARQCCHDMIGKADDPILQSEKHCPTKWDGFMCWDSAKPGTINSRTCPRMTYFPLGLKPTPCRNEMAHKECWTNGTWAMIWKLNVMGNSTRMVQDEWTNYHLCSTPGASHKLRFTRVSIAFYFLSLALTVVGLILLIKYGMKKQPTLSYIHVNFLTSLIISSVLSLCVLFFIKEKHYLLNSMVDKNPVWCRVLVVVQKTAQLTNYCWMLNEGIVLWQMIVLPFRKWAKMKIFLIIGWGFPILVMSGYTFVRFKDTFNNNCWTKSMGYWELIYHLPPTFFIMINVILLMSVVYILFKKLSSSNDDQHMRSSVRASLILVPVFGLQYIFYFVPFDPFESCTTFVFIGKYALLVTEASQGAIVAMIFCFFNKEIQHNIKSKYKKRNYFRSGTPTNTTEQIGLSRRTNT